MVAYYPELIAANVPSLKQTRFLDPYVGLWRHKDFGKRIAQLMHQEFGIPKKESAAAARAASPRPRRRAAAASSSHAAVWANSW